MQRQEKSFNQDLASIQQALIALYETLTEPGIPLEPIYIKQREIIDQILGLSPKNEGLINQLRSYWEYITKQPTTDDQINKIDLVKMSLIAVKAKLYELSNFLSEFKEGQEEALKNYISNLENACKNLNNINYANMRIAWVDYGRDLSTYGAYAGSATKALATIWLAYTTSLQDALEKVGAFFPPVVWTFNSLQALFNLGSSTLQFFGILKAAKSITSDEERQRELMEARLFLLKNIGARAIVFAMNVMTVLAFSGVLLTTPFAWLFVAVSSAAKWFDEQIIPVIRLENRYATAKASLDELAALKSTKLTQPEDIKRLGQLEAQETKLKYSVATLPQEIAIRRIEMTWGGLNVLAMGFIAAGPFIPIIATAIGLTGPMAPFIGGLVGLAGLALFGAVAARGAYIALPDIYKSAVDYFYPPKVPIEPIVESKKEMSFSSVAVLKQRFSQEVSPNLRTDLRAKIATNAIPMSDDAGTGVGLFASSADIKTKDSKPPNQITPAANKKPNLKG